VTRARAVATAFAALALAACAQPAPPPPTRMADVIANLGAITPHRASPTVCEHRAPRERDPKQPRRAPRDVSGSMESDCVTDEDCTQAANGHCAALMLKGSRLHACYYDECYTDADCRDGGVCECNAMQHRCVIGGNCRRDADCGAGRWCAPSVDCVGLVGYYCRTLADTCWPGSMCPGVSPRCAYDAKASHWSCRQCSAP